MAESLADASASPPALAMLGSYPSSFDQFAEDDR
jgi:hypothetical protein